KMQIKNTSIHNVLNIFDLIGFIRFINQCMIIKPYIIHCHDSRAFTYASLAAIFIGKRVIFTRKVIFPIKPTLFNIFKYRRCSHIIAISEAVNKKCLKIMQNKAKISIIPSGVRIPIKSLSKNECRKILNIPRNIFIIGSVAHFTKEKNISLVFNLASSLQKSHSNVLIVCVGSLTEYSVYEAEKYKNIVLTGVIKNIENFYSAFDLYISTSTKEGLGTALLDALVRDIPAVAMDSGGSRDLFIENCPLLIPRNNNRLFIETVKKVINHREEYNEYIHELGIFTRKHFSIDRMISNYEVLYESIIQ
ncbi:MAG: glycosyltransferase, partial [Chitinispirillia bacterium]